MVVGEGEGGGRCLRRSLIFDSPDWLDYDGG